MVQCRAAGFVKDTEMLAVDVYVGLPWMGDTQIQKNKAATYCLLQNRAQSEAYSHTTLQILDTSQQEDKSSTLLQVPTVPHIYPLSCAGAIPNYRTVC